jgi:hypothetical protein
MLPAPPSLNVWMRSLKRNVQRVLVVCVLLLLNLGLTGCGPSDQPPRGVLLKALGLQIQLTQTAIAQLPGVRACWRAGGESCARGRAGVDPSW